MSRLAVHRRKFVAMLFMMGGLAGGPCLSGERGTNGNHAGPATWESGTAPILARDWSEPCRIPESEELLSAVFAEARRLSPLRRKRYASD